MKKLILMLIVSVFTTAIYAQETKQQRAERILKVNQKKSTAPVVTRTTTVTSTRTTPETREQKARRLLNIKDKRTVVVPVTRTVVVPVNQTEKRKYVKRHHDNGKHLGWYKHGENDEGEDHNEGNHGHRGNKDHQGNHEHDD